MIVIKKKISIYKWDFISLTTFFLILLQFFYPISTLLPNLIQIPVFIVWIILVGSLSKSFAEILKKTILLYFFFFLILLRIILSGNISNDYFTPIKILIEIFQIIVAYSLYLFMKNFHSKKKRFVVNLIVNSIIISVVFSLFYVIFVDPQAIRNTQRSYLWGVGDFQLMYAISIFIGPYTYLAFKNKNKKEMFFCSLLWLCLLKCNLVTSLVIAILSLVLTILSHSKNKLINNSIFCFIIMLVLILRTKIANILFKIANSSFLYWSTQEKIIAIANLLIGGDELDTLSSRFDLMQQSWSSFLENPIFGINYKNYRSGVIGQHAQWIDELARLGLVGTTFLIYIIAKYLSEVYKNTSNCTDRENLISASIAFIVLGFLNPNLFGTNFFILFICIPNLTLRFRQE